MRVRTSGSVERLLGHVAGLRGLPAERQSSLLLPMLGTHQRSGARRSQFDLEGRLIVFETRGDLTTIGSFDDVFCDADCDWLT